uniref:ATP synthase F0 subunit 8 n=1 Tax=Nesophrosyne sp. 302 GMB-2012 TaxID=1223987 RepID=UPI0021820B85|nr:ATP synthase F0 subunit 8 [Nesophrosyne sp. 302 GMB-2012]UVI59669.1 ATP synthase F0 subunit 8 [Nesophrosyne sp. 302 GMB-2012]
MPQMAPMWWTTILLTTTMTLMLMMMINYFLSVKKIKLNMDNNSTKFKWTWY